MNNSLFLGVFLFFASVSLPKISAQPSGSGQPLSDTIRLVPLKIQEGKTLRSSALNDFKLPAGGVFLSPDFSQLNWLAEPATARYFSFDLPISATRTLPIVLEEVSVLGQSFAVTTSSGKSVALPALRFYRGKVVGDESSTVSLTSTADGLQGLVYGNGFSYTLDKIGGNNPARLHAVYATEEQPGKPDFRCESFGVLMSDTIDISSKNMVESPRGRTTVNDCRKVGIYFEADYLLFQQLNSNVSLVTSEITSLFNQVAVLYAREGVKIEISALKIWDTVDPYAAASESVDALELFAGYWRERNFSFDGDLAHLLSGKNLGGIAAIAYKKSTPKSIGDVTSGFFQASNRRRAFGFSGVPAVNSSIGWAVKLLAHEIGHNFGLPHTHSCLWEGGPIDNCSSPEDGTCAPGPAPQGGTGTIMSYCYTDLSKGFGPQPGAKMKYEFLVAEALTNPGLNAPVLSPSSVTVIQGQSVNLTVSGCGGSLVWSDGATTTGNRMVTPTLSTDYAVSCMNEGCQSASSVAKITVTCAAAVACMVIAPQGRSLYYGIAAFSLNTISTSDLYSSPSNINTNYEDLSCQQSTSLEAGNSYSFSLSCTFGNSANAKIYIDYNGDSAFSEQGELVYNGGSKAVHTGTITPPATATRNAPLRMRILLDPSASLSACTLPGTSLGSGKANDYAVTITGTTCPPGLRESVKSGDWSDPSVWSCGTLPASSDLVKINQSHVVSLSTGYVANALSIDLLGTIQYGANATVRLNQP